MEDCDHNQMLAKSRIEDTHARLGFQQEFSVEGFKTLVLINGGAIIALLTYAGHSAVTPVAARLAHALLAYTAGLICAVVAYLTAYLSQASLMNFDMLEAYRLLGIEPDTKKTRDDFEKSGMRHVSLGIGLSLLSLAAFIAGSWLAMDALS